MIGDKIKGLGEVVLRVNDMERMKLFYQKIVGLKLMRSSDDYTFFKLAKGYGGHDQVLALFNQTNLNAFGESLDSVKAKNSSLHHLALEINKNDREYIIKKLVEQNIDYVTEKFEWVKWKSIFIKDPEDNIVEFVCYDDKF